MHAPLLSPVALKYDRAARSTWLASGVAHELNNALSSQHLALGMIEQAAQAGGPADREDLDLLKSGATRVERCAKALARATAPSTTERRTAPDLRAMSQEIVSLLTETGRLRRMRLNLRGADAAPVAADVDDLEHLLFAAWTEIVFRCLHATGPQPLDCELVREGANVQITWRWEATFAPAAAVPSLGLGDAAIQTLASRCGCALHEGERSLAFHFVAKS